jgi:lysophospholipase L1-like esterase
MQIETRAVRGKGRMRLWLFRTMAMALGLSVFVWAELVCVLFDWGRPQNYDDPFVGFSAIHPLFVMDDEGKNYEIAPARRKFFAAESFPVEKKPSTFRAFCFGGSTVQGNPYSKQTSFTTWLQIALQSADDQHRWEVVNCGGISYASYRLVPILQECCEYQPDLFIICTGHNEFLEERTYGPIKHAPEVVAVPHRQLSRLRTFALLRSAAFELAGKPVASRPPTQPLLKEEVDALLDYKGGLKAYHRDDEWTACVIAHYEHNLRRMIAIAKARNIPVILIQPPSNLSDCPPFKSEHCAGLSPDDRQAWNRLVQKARNCYRDNLPRAVKLLNQAIEIDDQYALTFYELGQCYEILGQQEDARVAYLRARELDVCPLRILEPMEQALARAARKTRTPLLNAHELLEARSPTGILGDYLLADHIHPSIEGHKIIAQELVDVMQSQGWVRPTEGWQTRRDQAYAEHFASLDELYFLHGRRHLENLRIWTQGRADGPPIEEYRKAMP